MAFTVTDFADLVRLLAERPEWQAELRRLILSEDFLTLPRVVQELAEAQRHTEMQVRELAEAQRELAEAQRHTEMQVRELAEAQRELAEAQRRTEIQVRELSEAQRRTEMQVHELAEAQRRTEIQVRELSEAQRRTEMQVHELAEAQRRTEMQVHELAEAQRRTEMQVHELAEAQRRTEIQVRELSEAQRRTEMQVHELAEAQRRTEIQVRELAEAQRGLAIAFGQLQSSFGATIEEEAESILQMVLEGKGYRLLAAPYSLVLDGEVDVVMEVEDPAGERVWAVLEAKARLGHRQVRDWAQQIKSPGWQQRLAAQGIPGPYLVYTYGIRIDPNAVRAAEEHGIGLLTGRGERVSPKGLVRVPAGR